MGGYLFSVGRSNRDYNFLISAITDSDYKLIIACDTLSKKYENKNICIRNDISYGKSLYEMIANSYAMVISLNNTHISAGQFCFIQAMMFGKPIIVTKTDTLEEYVENENNGIIINKVDEELIAAIKKLEDINFYNNMCKRARKIYLDKFTAEASSKLIAKIILNNSKKKI